ncbi:hypothetical protein JF66_06550 [Cryobacterium sp. MLB-32]|uniref:LLM class flavin-dependent oxidoreductase n=1 Tax=Cryobacterium sp. MLB-32 TaxID=1529318 RepID=UPI0004E6DD57|nr:LLM class flavin-dependent oxidoreductase [Cryobacterium sp. MLB-32]KFF60108.1 hypothetical protein JF66_06550 [Cryobacterium sp. MLB-32]
MKLSILDQSSVRTNSTPAVAIRETVALARAVDTLGYTRFWVAEHHNSAGFAGSAPETLALAVLDNTEWMRVGTGGVLLSRYPSAKVAEVFNVIAALHPGRVDLGVGRAGGTDDSYVERLIELHRRLGLEPDAIARTDLEVWMLGAGQGSAPVAAMFGSGYAHAHFLNPRSGPRAMEAYSDGFSPNPHRPVPAPLLAVRVITAATVRGATRLRDAAQLWRSRKDLGRDLPLPGAQEAHEHSWTVDESKRRVANAELIVSGTPDQVRYELEDLARRNGVDELMINSPIADFSERQACFTLLAEEFSLGTS